MERNHPKKGLGNRNPQTEKVLAPLAHINETDKATKRVIAPYVKIVRKGQKAEKEAEESKQFSFYLKKKPSVLLRDLSSFLSDSVDLPSLLHETADVLKNVTKASGVNLYMVDSAADEIYHSQKNQIPERYKIRWKIQEGTIVAAFVANRKEYVKIDDILRDGRFPEGVGYEDGCVKSVLCVPIVTPDGDCFAVIELYRQLYVQPFQAEDLKITIVVTGWMGAAIHQNQQRLAMQRQQELNDYLLGLTKCYFSDTVDMEKMITGIVNFAKATLGAERGSFFIVDPESDELVADVFDEGVVGGEEKEEECLFKKKTQIRFGKDRGIAGLVARTGVAVNVKDAYGDARFNMEVDQKTGFITRSILCMPIMGVNGILGVVQLVNKKNGVCFTTTDENLFKTFSVYCALALHYSHIRTQMKKKIRMANISNMMLTLQMRPCIHDLEMFSSKPRIPVPPDFDEFSWYCNLSEFAKMPQFCFYMIDRVVNSTGINEGGLIEFILTIKKLYRENHYHNFEHAFNVTHCMYNILMRNVPRFSQIEMKSLIIAALGHDVDHLGFTNNYLELVSHDLAALYDEAYLEHHHYRITMMVFKECEVYKDLPKAEYQSLTKEIREAILATDLSRFFTCRVRLLKIMDTEAGFDWSSQAHRNYLKAIIMTSCDLSGQCKPFHIAKRITDCLYREFYNQGDHERYMGQSPLSIMDREKQHSIPEDQVRFLQFVVIPCVELLKKVLPNTEQMLIEAWLNMASSCGRNMYR